MAQISLVYGPPGCGKTTYLEEKIREAIERRGRESVLVVSLTKAAMAEMKSRGLELSKETAGTLHAICYYLQGSPELANSHLHEWNDQVMNHDYRLTPQFTKKSIEDIGLDEIDMIEGDTLYSQMNIYRAQMIPIERWPDHSVRLFGEKFYGWMIENDYKDFTGLIEECIKTNPIAPGAPQFIFADEVQDWCKLEMALVVHTWGPHAEKILLAGDPDQTIFGWRGADPECFMSLDVPEKNKIFLTQSYRLPESPHKYATDLIKRIPQDVRETVDFKPREEKGKVEYNDNIFRDPDSIIDLIEKEIKGGHEVMILASCAFMLIPMIETLKDNAIPFHNPYRKNNSYWNPLGQIKDSILPSNIVLAFLRPDSETFGSVAREWKLKELKMWIPALTSKGVLKRGVKAKLEDGRITVPENYEDFEKLFESPEHAEKAVAHDMEWFQENCLQKLKKPVQYFMKILKKRGGECLLNLPQVTVGTIHSVKGGEADTVIIYPDLSQKGFVRTYDTREGMYSTVRLFYVGVTRTKNKLILCSSTGGQFEW